MGAVEVWHPRTGDELRPTQGLEPCLEQGPEQGLCQEHGSRTSMESATDSVSKNLLPPSLPLADPYTFTQQHHAPGDSK